MSAITSIGKYFYAVVMAIFGIMHFINASAMAGMVPIPGGSIWIHITGAGLLAAAVSIVLGKLDKLATVLLALMLLIFALSIHLPGFMDMAAGEMAQQNSMSHLMKDIGLSGAALMYAHGLAKDKTGIG